MPFSTNQLVTMALMSLDEIAETCGGSPAPKSVMLRFLLAWLFEQSGARPENEWLFRQFWTVATGPLKPSEPMDDYIRGTGARTAINGICRALGRENDVTFAEERDAQRRRLQGRKVPTS